MNEQVWIVTTYGLTSPGRVEDLAFEEDGEQRKGADCLRGEGRCGGWCWVGGCSRGHCGNVVLLADYRHWNRLHGWHANTMQCATVSVRH